MVIMSGYSLQHHDFPSSLPFLSSSPLLIYFQAIFFIRWEYQPNGLLFFTIIRANTQLRCDDVRFLKHYGVPLGATYKTPTKQGFSPPHLVNKSPPTQQSVMISALPSAATSRGGSDANSNNIITSLLMAEKSKFQRGKRRNSDSAVHYLHHFNFKSFSSVSELFATAAAAAHPHLFSLFLSH